MVKTTNAPAKSVARKSAKVKDQSKKLADLVVNGMQEKKGEEIVTLDLRNLKNAIADYFVVCHARSRPQIEAIADSVEEVVHKYSSENPYHREGFENAEWILLDYVNVVVHIFNQEKRDFYGIERLWADAHIKRIAGNY